MSHWDGAQGQAKMAKNDYRSFLDMFRCSRFYTYGIFNVSSSQNMTIVRSVSK